MQEDDRVSLSNVHLGHLRVEHGDAGALVSVGGQDRGFGHVASPVSLRR
jgi:hypothetical protein